MGAPRPRRELPGPPGCRLAEAEALAHHPRFTLNAQEQAYLDAAVALRKREAEEREAQRRRELEAQRERAELAEAARREAEQRVTEQTAAAKRLRRRFLVAAGLGVLALLAAIGAFWGFRQAGEQQSVAEEQRSVAVFAANTAVAESERADHQAATAEVAANTALARQLQAQARYLSDEQLDLALFLSLEANHISDTTGSRGSLLVALSDNPRLTRHLHGQEQRVQALAFRAEGATLATGFDNGTVIL